MAEVFSTDDRLTTIVYLRKPKPALPELRPNHKSAEAAQTEDDIDDDKRRSHDLFND